MNSSQPCAIPINCELLNQHLLEQGGGFSRALSEQHDHLFADVALTISSEQLAQMQAVITAVEAVVRAGKSGVVSSALGVFYGYDFHLNSEGAHLIEINSNAGGAFLNALLIDSQREFGLPSKALADEDLWQSFIAMFRHEWQLARGDAPLNTIAIVDESPSTQYLYPEFYCPSSAPCSCFPRRTPTSHHTRLNESDPPLCHIVGLYDVLEHAAG